MPEAVNLSATTNQTLVVAVDQGGQLFFENQVIRHDQLKERLQSAVTEARQPLTLVVRADKKVELKELMPLWLLARAAGIKDIIQATRPPVAPIVASPRS